MTGHFYFAENRTFLLCLDNLHKIVDSAFEERVYLTRTVLVPPTHFFRILTNSVFKYYM
jgi:hypothetical protein